MAKSIITIGREFGSYGLDIGKRVAEELGLKIYDKDMLKRAAEESGLCEEIFETHDEKPTNSFLYSLVMDTYSLGYASGGFADMPLNHKVFLAQFDTIKNIAKEGPCVIVGRCADYALEDMDNVISIFIHADLDKRVKKIMKVTDLSAAKAKDMILKNDKKRASYYNYYTNKDWGAAKSYDLCLDSGKLGIEGTVKAILEYVKLRESVSDVEL